MKTVKKFMKLAKKELKLSEDVLVTINQLGDIYECKLIGDDGEVINQDFNSKEWKLAKLELETLKVEIVNA